MGTRAAAPGRPALVRRWRAAGPPHADSSPSTLPRQRCTNGHRRGLSCREPVRRDASMVPHARMGVRDGGGPLSRSPRAGRPGAHRQRPARGTAGPVRRAVGPGRYVRMDDATGRADQEGAGPVGMPAAGAGAAGGGAPGGTEGGAPRWPAAMPRRGTVALLHGIMSLGATWWQVGPELAARGWDVRALDLAAHGSSPPLAGPLTMDALVAKVVADLDGPVDLLVGHSLGARTAITAVARHPGLARAVVLEDPPGGDLGPAEEMARGVELDGELVQHRPGPVAAPVGRRAPGLGSARRRAGRRGHRPRPGAGRGRGPARRVAGRGPDPADRRRAGAGAGDRGRRLRRPRSATARPAARWVSRPGRRSGRPCRRNASSSCPAGTACTATSRTGGWPPSPASPTSCCRPAPRPADRPQTTQPLPAQVPIAVSRADSADSSAAGGSLAALPSLSRLVNSCGSAVRL